MISVSKATDIPEYCTTALRPLKKKKFTDKKQLSLTPLLDPKFIVGTTVFDQQKPGLCHKLTNPEELQKFELPSTSPKEVVFMSQNIWFEAHNMKERYNTLLEMMKESRADFICLQEVISPFTSAMAHDSYFTQNYFWSSNTIHSYGVLILSQWPCLFYELQFPTGMDRSLLVCQTQINGNNILVGTAHFESLSNESLREKQMAIAFKALNKCENSVLMGDFNFDPSWTREQQRIDKYYTDLYLNTGASESDGFTMPTTRRFARWRPDRMLAKTSHFEPLMFDIVGRFPCASYAGENIYDIKKDSKVRTPSDHFGLLGALKVL